MAEAIKIRVVLKGEIADIRILMPHAMENGRRQGENGQLVPAHFIQTFSVSHNGTPLIDGQLNASVARNPLFAFKARGIKAGERLTVAWVDSRGDERRDEIVVP